jgi:RimJ/RimL family protein N-acetyltransferase
MGYHCLTESSLKENGFEIKPVSVVDIELIRLWRNQQMDVLRQKKEISKLEQISYYEKSIVTLFDKEKPSQLVFSYFKDNILIGYGGLVHLSWDDKRAEMSFLLNPIYTKNDNVYKEYFSQFIDFMKQINFKQLSFHKLFTETYEHRNFHINILVDSGFQLEGILRDHVFLNNKYFNSLIHSIINDI